MFNPKIYPFLLLFLVLVSALIIYSAFNVDPNYFLFYLITGIVLGALTLYAILHKFISMIKSKL